MAAYLIIFAKIADRDTFISGYGVAAAKLVDQFGGRYVLRAPGAQSALAMAPAGDDDDVRLRSPRCAF